MALPWGAASAAAPTEHSPAIAMRVLPLMEQNLAMQAFLAAHPTLADLACYPYLVVAPEAGLPLAPYPNVRAWIGRLEALPRFKPMPRRP